MKRLYIAAVAGLCAVGSARAQEGGFAPTAPVVPPPMLKDGSLVAPNSGWGHGGPRLFANNNWSPLRSPVVPASGTGYAVPPLAGGACGPTGCAPGRGGFSLDRLKAFLCYQESPNPLPCLRPAPYVAPLQGMFGCSSGAGCATGCAPGAAGGYAVPQLPGAYPLPLPQTMPMTPPVAPGANAVMLPPRGTAGGPLQPTWQGRVTPMPAADATAAGYRIPALEAPTAPKPAQPQGPIVNTGGLARPGQR